MSGRLLSDPASWSRVLVPRPGPPPGPQSWSTLLISLLVHPPGPLLLIPFLVAPPGPTWLPLAYPLVPPWFPSWLLHGSLPWLPGWPPVGSQFPSPPGAPLRSTRDSPPLVPALVTLGPHKSPSGAPLVPPDIGKVPLLSTQPRRIIQIRRKETTIRSLRQTKSSTLQGHARKCVFIVMHHCHQRRHVSTTTRHRHHQMRM